MKRMGSTLAAVAAVFLVLVLLAGLSWPWALAGLTAVVVALLAFRRDAPPDRKPRTEAVTGLESIAPEKILSTMIEALPDPVMVLDRNSSILKANAPARAVFERIRLRQHMSTVIRAPLVLNAISHVLRTGESVMVDYEHRVPVDRRFEVHVALIGELDEANRFSGQPEVMVLMRDLTRQEQVERMRADFVANASHELRTPLASVLGFIETLQGAARNDEAARTSFLELMRVQAARMARLIDDLLSLNRIELNAHVKPEDHVRIDQVVRHVVDVLKPAALEDGVEIVLVAADESLVVKGDRDELVQVFQNLVENAAKYGQSGGKVDVGLSRDDKCAVVSIRDYGPGIAAEHLPRLTERFYRVDVAHSRQKGGTGLGLAIVKHILNRHAARLSVVSEPGEGATFSVRLPLSPENVGEPDENKIIA